MSRLIRLAAGAFAAAEDRYTFVPDDEAVAPGDVILSLARFQREGEALAGQARKVGVRLEPDEAVEDLAYDLTAIPVIELRFAKFRDGRPYTSARLLRERLGYQGEVRAVGDVLREQAQFMVRCGFDAFVPADGSSPEQWGEAARRFAHVYQRAADAHAPAFEERLGVAVQAGAGDGLGL
jgi:uncharacterized protein (DUF934 family)